MATGINHLYSTRVQLGDRVRQLLINVNANAVEQGLTASKIQEIIPFFIQQIPESPDSSHLTTIKITNFDEAQRRLAYSIGEGVQVITYPAVVNDINLISFKILKYNYLTTKKELTWWENLQLLFSRNAVLKYIPIFGWAIAGIWAKFWPPEHDIQRKLTRDEIEPAIAPPSPSNFLQFLALFGKQLKLQSESYLSPQQRTTLEQLITDIEACRTRGEKIQTALHKKDPSITLDSVATEFTREITHLAANLRLSIPLGYYKGSHYFPLLMTFYRDEANRLHCQMLQIDSGDADKFIPLQDYVFEAIDDARLKNILLALIPFQQTPTKEAEQPVGLTAADALSNVFALADKSSLKELQYDSQIKALERLQNHINLMERNPADYRSKFLRGEMGAAPFSDSAKVGQIQARLEEEKVLENFKDPWRPNTTTEEYKKSIEAALTDLRKKLADAKSAQGKKASEFQGDPRSALTIINSVIVGANGIPNPAPEVLQKPVTSSKSWTSLMMLEFNQRDRDFAKQLDLSIELSFVFNLIDAELRELENNRKLAFNQKLEQLSDLKKRIAHLEKQFKKEYGSDKVLSDVWKHSERAEARFKEAKEKIAALENQISARRYETLNRVKAEKPAWTTPIPQTFQKTKEAQGAPKAHDRNIQDLLKLIKIRMGIVQRPAVVNPELMDLTAKLEEFVDVLKSEVSQQNYLEAITASINLFSLFPSPGNELWSKLPEATLTTWTHKLSEMTQMVWESHIRLDQNHVWPSHLIQLLNVQGIHYRLLQRRRDIALAELKKKVNSISAAEMSGRINAAIDKIHTFNQTDKDTIRTTCTTLLGRIQRNEPFTLDNNTIYALGILAKVAGLSKQDLTALLCDRFAPAAMTQIERLIKDHPFYRFGRDPEIEAKAIQLKDFYSQGGSPNVVLLDSLRNNQKNDHCKDRDFLQHMHMALKTYDNEGYSITDIWSGSWQYGGKGKMDVFPEELIAIRRNNLFMQALLHPEAAIKRGFGSKVEQMRWAIKLDMEASKGTTDYDEKLRKCAEIEAKERRQLIDQLGTFELSVGTSAEELGEGIGFGPTIQITDRKGNIRLEYQPTGPDFTDYRDTKHDQALIGPPGIVPYRWIADKVYMQDQKKDKFVDRFAREQSGGENSCELTMINDEIDHTYSDLSKDQNARLHTLVVRGDHQKISTVTIDNVFQFIFDYPYLLEREDVVRTLELALYSLGTLQKLLREDPDYFVRSGFLERMSALIAEAIANKKHRTLAFLGLVHLNLRSHILYAQKYSRAQSEPLNLLASQGEEALFSVRFQDRIIAALLKNAKNPQVDPLDRKLAFTSMLAIYRARWLDLSREIANRDPRVWRPEEKTERKAALANILLAYYYITQTGGDVGDPSLQRELLDWVKGDIIADFDSAHEADRELTKHVFDYLSVDGDTLRFNQMQSDAALWMQNGSVFSKGGREFDVLVGIATRGEEAAPIETTLPRQILTDPRFESLFGKEPRKAMTQTRVIGNTTLYEYTFEVKGRKIRVELNPDRKEITIYQEILIPGKERPRWHKFVALPPQDVSGVPSNLVERYGIWQDIRHPSVGVLLLKTPELWQPEDLIRLKLKLEEDKHYKIIATRSVQGELLVDPAQSQMFLTTFGFAAPSNTLLLCDHKGHLREVRFLDFNVTLRRGKDGLWHGTGALEKYHLVTSKDAIQKLRSRFGQNFDQFMLPLESSDPKQNIVRTECLIFPIRYIPSKLRQEGERLKIDPESFKLKGLPALSVRFEKGKHASEEGLLQSSMGGFLSLAYYAYANKDYEKAMFFLKKAQESHLRETDIPIIEKMIENIRDHEDITLRGIAFRLKAELAIHHIEQNELGRKAFRPLTWQTYQLQMQKNVLLYQSYLDHRQHNTHRKTQLLGEELLLTPDEEAEFNRMMRESLYFLLDNPDFKTPPARAVAEPFQPQVITPQVLADFTAKLCNTLERPGSTEKHRLENLSVYPTAEEMLAPFMGFAEQIKREQIRPDDWRIHKLKNLSLSHLSREDAKAVETARQLLITLSLLNDDAAFAAFIAAIPEGEVLQAPIEIFAYLQNRNQNYPLKIDDSIYQSIEKLIKPYLGAPSEGFSGAVAIMLPKARSEISKVWGPELYTKDTLAPRLNQQFTNLVRWHECFVKYAPAAPAAAAPSRTQEKKKEFYAKLSQIKAKVDDPQSPFSEEEKIAWRILYDKMIKEGIDPDKAQNVLAYFEVLHRAEYEAAAARHAAETSKAIRIVENQIGRALPAVVTYGAVPAFQFLNEDFLGAATSFLYTFKQEFYVPEDPVIKIAAQQKVDQIAAEAKSKYPTDTPGMSEMEKAENSRTREGIDVAAANRKRAIVESAGNLREDKLEEADNRVLAEFKRSRDKASQLRSEILESLNENRSFLGEQLKTMLKHPDLHGEEEIFEKALDLYKSNKLVPTGLQLSPETQQKFTLLESKITRYLIEATACQQLSKAIGTLSSLFKLREQKATNPSFAITWRQLSNDLLRLLSDGLNKKRYLYEANLQLKNPAFDRKHLVAEYREEKIARGYQPMIVERLVNNRNALILLDPGSGKSKWIFPEAAFLIAEQHNRLPIILVTEEMLGISLNDMDESTRNMFRQASHVFNLTRRSPKDIAFLEDEYLRLLQAKRDKGYIITTLSNYAALDNEIGLAAEELKEKINNEIPPFVEKYKREVDPLLILNDPDAALKQVMEKLWKDPAAVKVFKEMIEIHKRRQWLMKIRHLINNPNCQFIADEVDDIFMINRQYNYSLGKPEITNKDLQTGIDDIMTTLMASDNPELRRVQALLRKGEQAELKGTMTVEGREISKTAPCMRALAAEFWRKTTAFGLPEAEWQSLKARFDNEEQFINYVTGVPGIHPARLKQPGEDANLTSLKYISILKRMLYKVLPNSIILKPTYNNGLNVDGCTVVPKKEGKALPGVRYSDEYELITFQYLFFASGSPFEDYFKNQWLNIQYALESEQGANSPWMEWYRSANLSEDMKPKERFDAIYNHFKAETSWRQRFALLKSDILKNHVKIYRRQAKCGSQDPLHGAHISGASGTMNPYMMPEGFEINEEVYSKKVLGDLHIKLAEMNPEGLNTEVPTFADAEKYLLDTACDMNIKFIINQEGVGGGSDIFTMLYKIRNELQRRGLKRNIYYKDPLRGQWVFRYDAPAPEPMKSASQKIEEDALTIFSSSDVRGTDFAMPPGAGDLVAGPTTVEEVLIQAILRARQFGEGQKVRIFISATFEAECLKSMGAPAGKHHLTYYDLLDIIKKRTMEERVRINFQAQTAKIEGMLPAAIRNVSYAPYVFDDIRYYAISPDNLEGLKTLIADICYDVVLYSATSEMVINNKDTDFNQELEPATEVNTIPELSSKYDKERVKSTRLRADLLELDAKKSAMINKTSCGLIKATDVERLVKDAQPRVIPLETALTDLTDERHQEGYQQKQVKFNQDRERHLRHLKPTCPASALSEQMVQEQTHEQQQQENQMLQQQLVSALESDDSSRRQVKKEHEWVKWHSHPNMQHQQGSTSYASAIAGLADPERRAQTFSCPHIKPISALTEDCGFDQEIVMTENYEAIIDKFKMRDGQLMGRVAIIQDETSRENPVMLLTDMYDYEYILSRAKEQLRDPRFIKRPSMKVCHLPLTNPRPCTVMEAGERIDWTPAHWRRLAQVKIFAGMISNFTDPEVAALERWIESLRPDQKVNLMKFIAKIHGATTVKNIPNWNQSPLARLLDTSLLIAV